MKRPSYELTAPAELFDASKAGELYITNQNLIQRLAVQHRRQYNVAPAWADVKRFPWLHFSVDRQLTFCHPQGALSLGQGAIDDTARSCVFLYRNARVITQTGASLDTHSPFQVFDPLYLVDKQTGLQHPLPQPGTAGTQIFARDIGVKWVPNPALLWIIWGINPEEDVDDFYSYLEAYLKHYTKFLESTEYVDPVTNETVQKDGQDPLMAWNVHAQFGSVEHALMPMWEAALKYHSVLRQNKILWLTKGEVLQSEFYGAGETECNYDQEGRFIGSVNDEFYQAAIGVLEQGGYLSFDQEASSHCGPATIKQVAKRVLAKNPDYAKHIIVYKDLGSPVPGLQLFTDNANKAYDYYRSIGITVVDDSETPIVDLPCIEPAHRDIIARLGQ